MPKPWIHHDLDWPARFWQHVDAVSNGCWEWQGAKRNGYGKTYSPSGVESNAHRVVYELEVGPLWSGSHIDHLCSNRACVNPDHLEQVTPGENARRALVKTHCDDCGTKREFYGGSRRCISCRREYCRTKMREYRSKLKELHA